MRPWLEGELPVWIETNKKATGEVHRGQIFNKLRITYLLTGALRGGRLTPPARELIRKYALFIEDTILSFIKWEFIMVFGRTSTPLSW